MNQPTAQATPYKTEPTKPETTYEVEDNGDVKITQIVKTTSWWKQREFLSLKRQNEDALEKTRYSYSQEFIDKMQKQEKEIIEEINIMDPIVQESEKLSKIEYEKMRHEGLKTSVIKAINDPNLNEGWWQQVWLRTKPEIKTPILDELDSDQKSKIAKILQKLKRKGIQ